MSFASRLATSFPKWGHIFRAADAAATPLPELRRVRCWIFYFFYFLPSFWLAIRDDHT